jgi:hypothetical protein
MLAEYKTMQRLAAAEKYVHLCVLRTEKKKKERKKKRTKRKDRSQTYKTTITRLGPTHDDPILITLRGQSLLITLIALLTVQLMGEFGVTEHSLLKSDWLRMPDGEHFARVNSFKTLSLF